MTLFRLTHTLQRTGNIGFGINHEQTANHHRLPSFRPDPTADCCWDSCRTWICFGTNRPSASTVMTRCSLPVSITAGRDQQHLLTLGVQLQICIHARLKPFVFVETCNRTCSVRVAGSTLGKMFHFQRETMYPGTPGPKCQTARSLSADTRWIQVWPR